MASNRQEGFANDTIVDATIVQEVWELLVEIGCELEHVLGEWKGRERMCARLQ